MKHKLQRPKIPTSIQLRLWVLAAGRCEFQGCNGLLLHDDLTLNEGNYSNIAHIISWTPTGPRGDAKLSPKLAKDIGNLMLMCQKHAKLIDDKKHIPFYTVEKLLTFKKMHEERIRIQTEIQAARKTLALRMESNIRGRRVQVDQHDVYSALLRAGRYPADEKGILIDLTGIEYAPDRAFWDTSARQIDAELASAFRVGNDGTRHSHLSVFALAPIPSLAYLGYRLGNTVPADIYIKVRGRNWFLRQRAPRVQFFTHRPKRAGGKQVALSIAISGTISPSSIYKATGMRLPIYEIKIRRPGLDSIRSEEDLEVYRKIYRSIMDEIRERHGKKAKVHLLAAIPCCVAVVCGREMLHGVDPAVILYEHGNQYSEFLPAITIGGQ
jgi:hypothetical protein